MTSVVTGAAVTDEQRIVLARPWKGLDFYSDTKADAFVFVGRETESKVIAANLIAQRLTVLYGPSGVGKSSVLHAGVAFELRLQAERFRLGDGSPPRFVVAIFRSWREDPVAGLLASVEHAVREALGDRPVEPVPAGIPLVEALEAWSDRLGGDLLIVLDQFEELFLYHAHDDESGFVGQFARAATQPGLHVNFLISLREDALAALDVFKTRIPGLLESRMRIDYLSTESARLAIERPLERYSGLSDTTGEPREIEPELTTALLAETTLEAGTEAEATVRRDDRIDTVALQVVLMELWDVAVAAGSERLELAALEQLGGAREIVRRSMTSAIEGLSAADQAVAAKAFVYLVTPAGRKISLSLDELAGATRVSDDVLAPVLESLSKARVLRVDQEADSPRYEIFHDSLARVVLEWRQRFEERAELEERERAERERREQERRRWKMRIGWLVACVLSLAIIGTTLAMVYARRERDRASSRALAANSLLQLGTNDELSLLLALEAAKHARTDEAGDALRAALLAAPVRRVVRRFDESASAAAITRDGRRVVSADRTGRVVVRRVDGRGEPVVLAGRGPGVRDLELSRDGSLVVVARGNEATVWSVAGGEPLARFRTEGIPVEAAAIAPDARSAVTGGRDGLARVWSMETGRELRAPLRHLGPVDDVSIAPDGRIATASDVARIWASDGRLLRTLTQADAKPLSPSEDGGGSTLTPTANDPADRSAASVDVLEFSPGGALLATGDSLGVGRVWRTRTGVLQETLRGHRDGMTSLAFSTDATRIVTGSADSTVRVWRPGNGREIAAVREGGPVTDVGFALGALRVLASSASDVRVWVPAGEPDRLVVPRQHTFAVDVAGDGLLVLLGYTGVLNVEDLQSQATIVDVRHRRAPRTVEFDAPTFTADADPEGTLLVTKRWFSPEIDVRSLTGHVMRTIHPGLDDPTPYLGRDGKLLLVDGDAELWDARRGRRVARLRTRDTDAMGGAISSDGRIVTYGPSGIRAWSRTGAFTAQVGNQGPQVNVARFSPNGALLAIGRENGAVSVWRTGSWKKPLIAFDHGAAVWDVAFSADSSTLAAASSDGTIVIWRSDASRPSTLVDFDESVLSLAFTPDGRTIMAAIGNDPYRAVAVDCVACGDAGVLRRVGEQVVTRELTPAEKERFAT
jgi:WD40 repeat protein